MIPKTVIEAPSISTDGEEKEYANILASYGLAVLLQDGYLYSGAPKHSFGWILHLSVIFSQMPKLLRTILPKLSAFRVPFKLAASEEILKLILDGHVGYEQLGKAISIYPATGEEALEIATSLVEATRNFQGPRIPTDTYLGSIVYARFGAHLPIQKVHPDGTFRKYYVGDKGDLICDSYDIPFQLTKNMNWPFSRIATPRVMSTKRNLSHRCRIVNAIKADARGEVLKGVYMKSFLNVKNCVIKEGKQGMTSDEAGRDMRDRLSWQYRLYEELHTTIPLPEVYEYFEDDGNAYLVMEFIKGISLFDLVQAMRGNTRGWLDFSPEEKKQVLTPFQAILLHIQALHDQGYVHRDITPVNFLINDHHAIVLIDIELAYSIKDHFPTPPFGFGTLGFVSPEQAAGIRPTPKEDIYGIGATLLQITVGLSPLKFNGMERTRLEHSLHFFLESRSLASVIAASLSEDPVQRPCISDIQSVLSEYIQQLSAPVQANKSKPATPYIGSLNLDFVIEGAIRGLSAAPTLLLDGLWASKTGQTAQSIVNERKTFGVRPGFYDGLTGVLYVLARASSLGFNIEPCRKPFYSGWKYLQEILKGEKGMLSGGLQGGTAGIATALRESYRAHLFGESITLPASLDGLLKRPVTGLSVGNGLAGQGIAALICADLLGQNKTKELLDPIVSIILSKQTRKGYWQDGPGPQYIGLSVGTAGIIWFLYNYSSHFQDPRARSAADRALAWLFGRTNNLASIFDPKRLSEIAPFEIPIEDPGPLGIIALIIHIFEISPCPDYRKMVESTLNRLPAFTINNNLSQVSGLAGLGEIYLNAYNAFGDHAWLKRAIWIGQTIINCANIDSDNSFSWKFTEGIIATADLMTGAAGIIHFLMRLSHPEKVSYRAWT